MHTLTAALKTLEDLEAISRGSVEPADGWTAHYARESAARAVVQGLIADERDARDAAKEAAIQASPERMAERAAFACFFRE